MTQNEMRAQVEWAYNLYNENLTEEDQKSILSFLLLFNVFEARLFNDGKNVNLLLNKICEDLKKEPWFDISEYDFYGDFFSQRYVTEDGKITHKFEQLRITGGASDGKRVKYKCKEALCNFKFKIGEEKRNHYLFNCYLVIAYRFRNNLFHGNKNVLGLNVFKECFDKINRLMNKLLLDMIENDFHGLKNKY